MRRLTIPCAIVLVATLIAGALTLGSAAPGHAAWATAQEEAGQSAPCPFHSAAAEEQAGMATLIASPEPEDAANDHCVGLCCGVCYAWALPETATAGAKSQPERRSGNYAPLRSGPAEFDDPPPRPVFA